MDTQDELLFKLGTFLQLPKSEQVRMTKEILENQELILDIKAVLRNETCCEECSVVKIKSLLTNSTGGSS